eukprot:GILJ01001239.1.p2 GENE.GILJ01001239.1~~GILJ01001239.1.p2  ORF type:complete len:200 (-),score=57.67 GILJ01001239.1:2057-2656(-)
MPKQRGGRGGGAPPSRGKKWTRAPRGARMFAEEEEELRARAAAEGVDIWEVRRPKQEVESSDEEEEGGEEQTRGEAGDLPPSGSEGEEEEEEAPKPAAKPKAAAASAAVPAAPAAQMENPNRAPAKSEAAVELSRREREELAKQEARRRYEEMHAAGKTEQAKADLARLAEVKRRREEAAKKRAEEEKRKADAKATTRR